MEKKLCVIYSVYLNLTGQNCGTKMETIYLMTDKQAYSSVPGLKKIRKDELRPFINITAIFAIKIAPQNGLFS